MTIIKILLCKLYKVIGMERIQILKIASLLLHLFPGKPKLVAVLGYWH